MKEYYDRQSTRYYCDRCGSPIEVESNAFYEFSGPEDPEFWCPACEDLPQAVTLGTPARDLPIDFPLPKGFLVRNVPLAEPGDVKNWNVIYRPFSTRSFLRQYIDWLLPQKDLSGCNLTSHFTAGATFDPESQRYTTNLDYLISDVCNSRPCEFLQTGSVKPVDVGCSVVAELCDIQGPYGMCQTGDEAMILKRYLALNSGQHFPMLIPQPTLLKGQKRPDFLCFVPLGKFQYQKVAILIDRPGKDPKEVWRETKLYEDQGCLVRRIEIDPSSKNYFIEARRLSNWIESIPRSGSRPPLSDLRSKIENPLSWARILAEDPQQRMDIETGHFEDGTMGRFLQDGLKQLDDLE